MAEQTLQDMLRANREAASSVATPIKIKDLMHYAPPVVFTIGCADPRANPTDIFQLKSGTMPAIRNAGGRAADALRSLELISSLLLIGIVLVVHHTDCGNLNTTDDEVHGKLAERAPGHAAEVEVKWHGAFKDVGLDASIREDVQLIRNWHFLPKDCRVVGYAYDLDTGLVREIDTSDIAKAEL